MTAASKRARSATAAIGWLLAAFAFGTGLFAAAGWTASHVMGTSLDLMTRVMTASFVWCIVSMALMARTSPFGLLGAVFLGALGLAGAALLIIRGEGDEMSTRIFPVVVAVTSTALIAVSVIWARSVTLRVAWPDIAVLLVSLGAVVGILAHGW